ncbi:Plasma membrane sulfite pump involved in sulfite metabolism [Recurvomyces mirabilis]|uniref:Sulfite efflux pump SSU1 n=1 Tax=Recurvomyces mirabilis TaxID=574656 RepID=A0AAE0TNW5_9PEZI|nr:Plasma membrane sulfite pump involved in sulfite metabolism [Recurvomyces mirabilis]KAK5152091.1 Plasma membrane sulfite pump involved in sulfite metabolism [Recurvomyces mirabilis]
MDPAMDGVCGDSNLSAAAGTCNDHDSSFQSGNNQSCATPDTSELETGCAIASTCKTSKYQHGWRRIVQNFTPSWFAVNMGTGIVSILLHNLPYNAHWLRYISYVVFALNVLLFVLFLLISILRYTLYPKIWVAMLQHPMQSLFLGCFPMGLATIINMTCFVCVPAWGGGWWKVAWALWWIDAAIATSTCLYLPFVIMLYHDAKLENVTAAWLLPIVSTIVAAATGSIVAAIMPHPQLQLITIITSYILWGKGVSLAMVVLVCYFLRLTTQRLPPKEVIVSVFLPLGPLGQGGFCIQNLGSVARQVFRETDTLPLSMVYAGDILYIVGFMIGMVMWAFGLVWFFFALATIWHTPKFPFNLGWWGFTFPLGVYTVCTTQLAKELPSAFFRVVGTAFSVAVTLLWIVVTCGTLKSAYSGEILVAPCLKDLTDQDMESHFMHRGGPQNRKEG